MYVNLYHKYPYILEFENNEIRQWARPSFATKLVHCVEHNTEKLGLKHRSHKPEVSRRPETAFCDWRQETLLVLFICL